MSYISTYMEKYGFKKLMDKIEDISKKFDLPYIENPTYEDNDEIERQTKIIEEELKKELES